MMRRDVSIAAIADKYIGRNGAPVARMPSRSRRDESPKLPDEEKAKAVAALQHLNGVARRLSDRDRRKGAESAVSDLVDILRRRLGVEPPTWRI